MTSHHPQRRTQLKRMTAAGVLSSLPAPLVFADTPKRGGTLIIGTVNVPRHLNGAVQSGVATAIPSSQIFASPLRYDDQWNPKPYLAESWKLADDGLSLTLNLRKDALFHDGKPITSADVAFTVMAIKANHPFQTMLGPVEKVDTPDPHTAVIRMRDPHPAIILAMSPALCPILPKHIYGDGQDLKSHPRNTTDVVGSGPFRVTEFRGNDVISFEANPHYRDAAKPAFATVMLKGGGDAAAAARAVLETGEFDYAWNLQVEPEILDQMSAAGRGVLLTSFGTSVERMELNWTNPSPDKGAIRSTVEAGPHPFLSDPAVRKALSISIDRDLLVEAGYGATGRPTCNILPAPDLYASTNVDWCLNYDVEEANRLLDEAGWERGGDGVRAKDGVRLSILYQTSTNSVRQATQALVKDMWQQIGVETELRNIEAAVFFGGDPASPDTFQKFYADIEMYTNNFPGTDPEAYMAGWLCSGIPSPDNGWLGANMPRFCSEEYDALVDEMAKTAELEKRGEIAVKMNDILSNEGALIPLIHRGDVSAHSVTLEGVRMNSWDSELWNVADWTRKK